jgi:hypothetical protein
MATNNNMHRCTSSSPHNNPSIYTVICLGHGSLASLSQRQTTYTSLSHPKVNMLLLYSALVLYATTLAASSVSYPRNAPLPDKLLADLSRAKDQLVANQSESLVSLVKDETERLNVIASSTGEESAQRKASRACQIMGVLFGNRTVVANSSAYVSEEQESWYPFIRLFPCRTAGLTGGVGPRQHGFPLRVLCRYKMRPRSLLPLMW